MNHRKISYFRHFIHGLKLPDDMKKSMKREAPNPILQIDKRLRMVTNFCYVIDRKWTYQYSYYLIQRSPLYPIYDGKIYDLGPIVFCDYFLSIKLRPTFFILNKMGHKVMEFSSQFSGSLVIMMVWFIATLTRCLMKITCLVIRFSKKVWSNCQKVISFYSQYIISTV